MTVSEERLRHMLAHIGPPSVDLAVICRTDELHSILTELLSLRSDAHTSGEVDEAEAWCRLAGKGIDALDAISGWEVESDDEDAAGLMAEFADNAAEEIRKNFPALSLGHPIQGAAVAWINGEREIMLGWFRRFIDEQYACGQVDDGMRLERLHALLSASPQPPTPAGVRGITEDRDRLIHILVVHYDMFRDKAEEAADLFLHHKTLAAAKRAGG